MKGIFIAFACTVTVLPMIPSVTDVTFVHSKNEEAKKAFITVYAEVSAYTSSVGETDSNPWETASGSTVHVGTLACPSKYAFGTKVEINSQMYTCEDRMNKRYRDKENFDVWVSSKKAAYKVGRQEIAIKVYSPEKELAYK